MTVKREAIDIANSSDLVQLIEEMRRRNSSVVLRNRDEDLAVVFPLADNTRPKARRSPVTRNSQAAVDAFLAAAGGWKNVVDTEQLKRDIRESRDRSSRPPIEP